VQIAKIHDLISKRPLKTLVAGIVKTAFEKSLDVIEAFANNRISNIDGLVKEYDLANILTEFSRGNTKKLAECIKHNTPSARYEYAKQFAFILRNQENLYVRRTTDLIGDTSHNYSLKDIGDIILDIGDGKFKTGIPSTHIEKSFNHEFVNIFMKFLSRTIDQVTAIKRIAVANPIKAFCW
jgi:hypothetical protein